jgi:acyl carrier protein
VHKRSRPCRGYVNNEALTRERFIVHPFSAGEYLYKTGDLARWLSDGSIEFLGRIDTQVKIRGYRIELGEIESQLSKHELINEAAVVARGEGSDKYLVAYYASPAPLEGQHLRSYLSITLPGYMLPSYFVQVKSLPLTVHGKLDRRALPEPAIGTTDYMGASNEVEEKLVVIWSEILKIPGDKISIHSNFFELGGHSINIISLSHEITRQFHCTISVANMFRLPTIAMIANHILNGDNSTIELAGHIEASLIEAEDNINILNQLDE